MDIKVEEQQRISALKSRLRATQEQNECMYSLIERTKKMIQRTRLERALLLEKIEQVARAPRDDISPPRSPILSMHPFDEEGDDTSNKQNRPGNKLHNAYTVFCEEEREKVVSELITETGQPKTTAIQKALSEKWKALGKDERKLYTEKAKKKKEADERVVESVSDVNAPLVNK